MGVFLFVKLFTKGAWVGIILLIYLRETGVKDLISKMTIEEKIAIVSGTDFMYTNAISRLNIPSICMADGPHGLRKQTGKMDNGIAQSLPSTAFPTASTTACGWNEDNLYKMGDAIAKECAYYGVDTLLGPAINIKRNPLCGRNFEYFSEDPYLAGKLASAQIRGVQQNGISTCLKHFALNNNEDFRFYGDSVCDERTAREIYLKPFEIAVKESAPHSIMCAYNKVNGEFCSENSWLLTDVLREEWNYQGLVMTDWGATHDRVKGLKAGLDLEMPGDTAICRRALYNAIKSGDLDEKTLDKSVERVLNLINKHAESKATNCGTEKGCTEKDCATNLEPPFDFESHNDLCAEIAKDCAVLLKNDGALPLNKKEKVLIVGDLFEKMRYQGAGSSMINATKVTSPKQAFDKYGALYDFARGYIASESQTDAPLLQDALNKAENFEKVIIFAGLTDLVESEGCDRQTLRLPKNQLDLINGVISLNKKVVVVLYGGSVIELPFNDKVNAILDMFLPGQNGGQATYDLLYGNACPSGKLSETWVKNYTCVPYGKEYQTSPVHLYKESVFVGYRYYAYHMDKVLYPFGYGLSYTNFSYADLAVERDKENREIRLEFNLSNVGNFDGAEVVEIYVTAPSGNVFRPKKELKAFKKVFLKSGETKRVAISLNEQDFAYYSVSNGKYILDGGRYLLHVASSSVKTELSAHILIDGNADNYTADMGDTNMQPPEYSARVLDAYSKDVAKISDDIFIEMSGLSVPVVESKLPITLESRFYDLNQTFMGRILYSAVTGVANRKLKKAKKLPKGERRDNEIKGAIFLKRIFDTETLIGMTMTAGKQFPYNFAKGFMHLANGKIFSGIACFLRPIKAPKLTKKNKKS